MSIERENVNNLTLHDQAEKVIMRWEPTPGDPVYFIDEKKTYGIIMSVMDNDEVLILWSHPPTSTMRTAADVIESMRRQIQLEEDDEIMRILEASDAAAASNIIPPPR